MTLSYGQSGYCCDPTRPRVINASASLPFQATEISYSNLNKSRFPRSTPLTKSSTCSPDRNSPPWPHHEVAVSTFPFSFLPFEPTAVAPSQCSPPGPPAWPAVPHATHYLPFFHRDHLVGKHHPQLEKYPSPLLTSLKPFIQWWAYVMPWHVCFSLFVCVGDTGDLGWYALSSIHRRKQQTDPTDAERACTVDGRATCPHYKKCGDLWQIFFDILMERHNCTQSMTNLKVWALGPKLNDVLLNSS